MARLPDAGYRPIDLTPNRPVARLDAGAIAQGETAIAQAFGRSGEALARALQQGGDALAQALAGEGRIGQAVAAAGLNLGQAYQAAGAAQGRTIEEVGERAGRATRGAGQELGSALTKGGEAVAKAHANAASTEAQGLRNFASGLQGIGKAAFELQRRERLGLARAKADFLIRKASVDVERDRDDLPEVSAEWYGRALDDVRETSGGALANTPVRELFDVGVDPVVARSVVRAVRRSSEVEAHAVLSDATQKLTALKDAALLAPDDTGLVVDAGSELIASLEDAGHIDAAAARELRERWTYDYAEAWTQGRPLDARVALLVASLDGEPTSTPVDFLRKAKAVELHRQATVQVLEQKRRVESEAALERHKLAGELDHDVAEMTATGRGRAGLELETVERVLGSAARQHWLEAREDAHVIWTNTHDLSTLPEPEIAARLAALRQDASASERNQAILVEVEKRASLIRRLRREDPARSVNDDPAVRAAAQALDPAKPETFLPLAEARLAAQARAGIPELVRSAIRRDEALRLTAPLRRAQPAHEDNAWNETARQFRAMFGRHADAAFADALRVSQVNSP